MLASTVDRPQLSTTDDPDLPQTAPATMAPDPPPHRRRRPPRRSDHSHHLTRHNGLRTLLTAARLATMIGYGRGTRFRPAAVPLACIAWVYELAKGRVLVMRRAPLIAALGVTCYLVVLPVSGSLAAAGASAPGPVSYQVTRGHAVRIGASLAGVAGLRAVNSALGAQPRGLLVPFRSPGGSSPAATGPSATSGAAQAPNAGADAVAAVGSSAASAGASGAAVVHSFN